MKTLDSIVEKALSRRSFLAGAGAIAATAAVTGCSNSNLGTTPATTTPVTTAPVTTTSTGASYTDSDVLNFALNLEYLEAQFYVYAATGSGLSPTDTAAPSGYTGTFKAGTVTVGNAAAVPGLTTAQQDILNEIAFEEQTHVQFLRAALGAAAVPMPNIDLSFFGPLAMAAMIPLPTGVTAFNPFASFDYFLLGAFVFEDVGVTAYSGAAPLISAMGVASGYLNAAAGILAVEAYHAAYVRTALTANAIAAGTTTASDPYVSAANLIENLRASLTVSNNAAPSTNGSVETYLVVPTSPSTPSAIVAASPTTAVGFARTVNEVHHIVYGSPTVGVASGGFFPSGTNSIFATTTA